MELCRMILGISRLNLTLRVFLIFRRRRKRMVVIVHRKLIIATFCRRLFSVGQQCCRRPLMTQLFEISILPTSPRTYAKDRCVAAEFPIISQRTVANCARGGYVTRLCEK